MPSAAQFEITPIFNQDLVKSPMELDPTWSSGVMRVVLSGPGDPTEWHVRIVYGNGESFALEGDALSTRTVRQDASGIVVDLPVPLTGQVWASASVSGVRVRPTAVLAISTIRPQQKIDGSTVRSLGESSSVLEKSKASAFGRLEVLDAKNGFLGVCTAFRIARSYWLTAAHCVYRDAVSSNARPMERWRLQPDAFAGRLEGVTLLDARPVASGLAAVTPTSTTLLLPKDQDYAVLQVDADPGGPVFTLTAKPEPVPGTKVELLQHWKADITPPPAGKAVSDNCAIREHVEVDDYGNSANCPFTLQHTCSSLGGGSGGALVETSNFALVGLHYGAGKDGKFNCAVPAKRIATDICLRHQPIAGKVTQCVPTAVTPKP